MAQRIQRRRTRGWHTPAGAVYVGRPTAWGNPFTVAEALANDPDATEAQARQRCVNLYRDWLDGAESPSSAALEARRRWVLEHLHRLVGRDLACWCPPGQPCHADVLIAAAHRAAAPVPGT